MIYEQLFESRPERVVKVGLIGTGMYGTSLVAQAQRVPRMNLMVICDRDPKAAQAACREAGLPEERISQCGSRAEALDAIEKGLCAIVEEGELLAELPLDVIVECTGQSEEGARFAELAINSGKHVVMVNKEADSIVGPILNHLALRQGVIYTPADGDQPSLLIGLIKWAQGLGLHVICGGKGLESDAVFDSSTGKVALGSAETTLEENQRALLASIRPGEADRVVTDRAACLKGLLYVDPGTLCETVLVANAVGMDVDTPTLRKPFLRIPEIPEAMAPIGDGGILEKSGIIDAVACLRRDDEPGIGGGVFIVVSYNNSYVRDILARKGVLSSSNQRYGLLYRPYHLLGVETATSILSAALLEIPSGATEIHPRVDLVARSATDLKAGSMVAIENAHPLLEPLILPASHQAEDSPIPLYMALGRQLKRDVPSNTLLTYGMIESPAKSALWRLRQDQDRIFLEGKSGVV